MQSVSTINFIIFRATQDHGDYPSRNEETTKSRWTWHQHPKREQNIVKRFVVLWIFISPLSVICFLQVHFFRLGYSQKARGELFQRMPWLCCLYSQSLKMYMTIDLDTIISDEFSILSYSQKQLKRWKLSLKRWRNKLLTLKMTSTLSKRTALVWKVRIYRSVSVCLNWKSYCFLYRSASLI